MKSRSCSKLQGLIFCLLMCWSVGVPLWAKEGQASTATEQHVDTDENEGEGSDETIQEEEESEFLSMSLEELLEVPITTVASRREEKVTDAPGIIKVYSSDDIEKYGYYTLHELAQITSGYHSQSRYDLTSFTVRGLPAGGWDNNKILLLVDEIPINMARNYHAWSEEELPLFFADRVEFLKGPASALYGTGAFLGVINITSKSVEPGESLFETKMSVGNDPYNSKRLMTNLVINKGGIEGRLFAGYFNKDARRDVFLDSAHMWGGVDEPHYSRNYDNSRNLFLNTSVTITDEDSWFEGFTPGFFLLEKRGGLGTGWEGFSHRVNDITYRSFIPYLKYQHNISEALAVNAYAKYQRYNEEGTWWFRMENDPDPSDSGILLRSYRVVVPNFESKVDLTYQFSKDFEVMVGAYYDVRYEKGWPKEYVYGVGLDPPYYSPDQTHIEASGKFETKSYYAQLKKDFDLLAGLGVTLGGRYDMGDTYEQFSPRAGFVQHITKNLGLKALYGSALKSPGIKEYGYNTEPQHLGEPGNIDPETIETYEVSLIWTDSKLNASATYFNNTIEDPIARIAHSSGTTVFGNESGSLKSEGVELEGEWLFVPGGKMFANVTMQESEDDTGSDIPLVPSWTSNLGLAYDIKPLDLTVATVVKHTGDYKRQGNDYVVSRAGAKLDGATIWDINLIKEINENVSLELQIKNLLDKKYYHPGEDSWQAWDYLQPGRTILGTVSIRF